MAVFQCGSDNAALGLHERGEGVMDVVAKTLNGTLVLVIPCILRAVMERVGKVVRFTRVARETDGEEIREAWETRCEALDRVWVVAE